MPLFGNLPTLECPKCDEKHAHFAAAKRRETPRRITGAGS